MSEVDTPPENSNDPNASGESEKDTRMWGMFAHLAALTGFVIPFGNLIGPFIVWQVKKEEPFIETQAKESLNFQITVSIAAIVCLILTLVLIGALLLPLLGLAALVLTVLAGLKANQGESYRYPFCLRLIK